MATLTSGMTMSIMIFSNTNKTIVWGIIIMRRFAAFLLSLTVLLGLAGCGCEHVYDDGVVTTEPTCVATGVKTFTCTKCGESYTEEVPLVEHTYVAEVTKEPTFEEEGITTYTGSVCGDSYTEAIPVREDKVVVTVYGKDVVDVESKYSAYGLYPRVFVGLYVENRTDKDIKGVKGVLTVFDMFGDVLLVHDSFFDQVIIKAGTSEAYTVSSDVFPNDTELRRLFDANYEDLSFEFELEQIAYTDGTKDVFE